MMAQENMQEWGHDVTIDLETVRAVVQAFADGKIELGKPQSRRDQWRYAPSFRQAEQGGAGTAAYTATQVADFIGWEITLAKNTLQALECIEARTLREGDLKGLRRKQAAAVVREAHAELAESERIARQHESVGNTKRAAQVREQGRKAAPDGWRPGGAGGQAPSRSSLLGHPAEPSFWAARRRGAETPFQAGRAGSVR